MILFDVRHEEQQLQRIYSLTELYLEPWCRSWVSVLDSVWLWPVHPQQIQVDPPKAEFGEDVAVEVSKHHAPDQAELDLPLLYAENALQAEWFPTPAPQVSWLDYT